MWQITGIGHSPGTKLGSIHLYRLDDKGEETDECMILPITTTEKFDFKKTPETLSDGAVADLLRDILETLDPEGEESPAFIIRTTVTRARASRPAKAKVLGHIQQQMFTNM